MSDTPRLSDKVGDGQKNLPQDISIVRAGLIDMMNADLLPKYKKSLAPDGPWDANVKAALKAVESEYFYGEANPSNILENDSSLFQFIIHAGAACKHLPPSLSAEMYHLAAIMVPGGADRVVTHKVRHSSLVNGKPHTTSEVKTTIKSGEIRHYLPEILTALSGQKLNDTVMVMMALGTIRAETAGFAPIDEGVSKFNTTKPGTKGRHPFDKYDHRTDIGNDGSGDGARYKGRGFVQLTGHDGYVKVGDAINVDLEDDPDQANDPVIAAKILAQFLKDKEAAIRRAVLADDLRSARKLVNGGSHGLAEFVSAFNIGRTYLRIKVAHHAKTKIRSRKAVRR